MQIEIKRWTDGGIIIAGEYADVRAAVTGANLNDADLRGADLTGANLTGAYLRGANLTGAYLRGAYLTGANLTGAYLRGANLTGADLNDADLRGADLNDADLTDANFRGADFTNADFRGANFRGAIGINPHRTSPLYALLRDQPGRIRAYKLVTASGEGPYSGGIIYEVGQTYSAGDWDGDETHDCGPGIHLATMDWCLRQWRIGYRILVAEFTAKDIVAIPHATDGKFRVKRCKIVAEKDLSELGIV